jgi:hypothetical protein
VVVRVRVPELAHCQEVIVSVRRTIHRLGERRIRLATRSRGAILPPPSAWPTAIGTERSKGFPG